MLSEHLSNDGKTGEKEIDLFIQRFVTDDIYAAAGKWLFSNKDAVQSIRKSFADPDSAHIENINYKYAANIECVEDDLLFDAVLDCCLSGLKQSGDSDRRLFITQRMTLKCKVTFNEGSINFTSPSAYRGDAVRNKHREYPADENMVPVVSKDSLDIEAAHFLSVYCPEALINPQPVPIMKILKEKMGLYILPGVETTSAEEARDGQIFGKIYFSPTMIEFQCPATKEMKTGKVPRGTTVIDPSTMSSDIQGILENTLAHEGFHWFRHRVYATICHMLYGNTFIACRNSKVTQLQETWTNEQRLEWQAKSIAPRILMSVESFKMKAGELLASYTYNALENDTALNAIIKELADFFVVSRQSVMIRLMETGFLNRGTDSGCLRNSRGFGVTTSITSEDAFQEYCENEDFRAMVDTGAVCRVDSHFIVNDPRYIERAGDKLRLTAYAHGHLLECALVFTLRKEYPRQAKGIAYRVDNNKLRTIPKLEREQNGKSKLDYIAKLQRRFDDEFEEFAAVTPTFSKLAIDLMERNHWNSQIFKDKTLLDDTAYNRIMNNKAKNITIRTVAAFCVGICAGIELANKLFAAAGLTFNNSKQRFAYSYVLRTMPGCSIDECNDFLESIGYEALGNRSREKKMAIG